MLKEINLIVLNFIRKKHTINNSPKKVGVDYEVYFYLITNTVLQIAQVCINLVSVLHHIIIKNFFYQVDLVIDENLFVSTGTKVVQVF